MQEGGAPKDDRVGSGLSLDVDAVPVLCRIRVEADGKVIGSSTVYLMPGEVADTQAMLVRTFQTKGVADPNVQIYPA